MAKAWKQYTKEMAVKFGYFATWEPGVPLAVGDVGVIRRNLFTRISTLDDFKIKFDVRKDPTTTKLSHASSGKVKITFKAAGKPALPGSSLADAQAGVSIDFYSENATVFETIECRTEAIKDQVAVGKAVAELYAGGGWNKDWVVITEIISSGSGTVLISAAKNAKIELSASATVTGASFNLADAKLGLTIENSTNMHTSIVATEGLTPLFKARGLKTDVPLNSHLVAAHLEAIDTLSPKAAAERVYFGNVKFDLHETTSDEHEA
jgi:hypothetical protein